MSVVFFTDRDLGLQFPRILREAGIHVERHDDHFPSNCTDDVWLRETATKGWIALTHDARIRYKPNELAEISSSRAIDGFNRRCQPQLSSALTECERLAEWIN